MHYADGEKRYILAPKGLEVGATVIRAKNRYTQYVKFFRIVW